MAEHYHHLSGMERALNEAHFDVGPYPSWIGKVLQRARSTITREIARKWMEGSSPKRDYRGRVSMSGGGRARRQRKLVVSNPLWRTVVGYLGQDLRPVQIASTLGRMADPIQLSHETIYSSLYATPRRQLRAEVLDFLRRGHKRRRPYNSKKRATSLFLI